MRSLSSLLLILLHNAQVLAETNFFKEFIVKFRNEEISPCDNFFRHICPRNLRREDSYEWYSVRKVRAWRDPGDQWVNDTLKDVKTAPLKVSRKLRQLFRSNRAEAKLLHFVTLLKPRAALLHAIGNESHPLHNYTYDRLEDMHRDLSGLVFGELHFPGNPAYSLREEWDSLFYQQFAILGMNREQSPQLPTQYLKFYAQFFKKYSNYLRDYDRTPFDSDKQLSTRFEELSLLGLHYANLIATFRMKYLSIKETGRKPNAFNLSQRFVTITETTLAGVMEEDIPEAIFLSIAGIITSHEMYHTYLDGSYANASFPELSKERDCQIDYYEKACILWKEGDCHSGNLTWTEDAPDLEGAQLAWKLFEQRMGDKRKDLLYPELNVTHEQMFFYSVPAFFCSPYEDMQHHYDESTGAFNVHSAAVARYNALFSLLKPFQEAFNCQPTDKMVQRSKCNFFGSDVRR